MPSLSDARLKIYVDLIKIALGTTMVGIATVVVNWQIQEKQIEIKKIEQDNKHLLSFVGYIVDPDLSKKKSIAKFYSTMTQSEETRNRWSDFIKIVEKEIKDKLGRDENLQIALNAFHQIEKKLREDIKSAKSDRNRIEVRRLEFKISELEKSIKKTEKIISQYRQQKIIKQSMDISSNVLRAY